MRTFFDAATALPATLASPSVRLRCPPARIGMVAERHCHLSATPAEAIGEACTNVGGQLAWPAQAWRKETCLPGQSKLDGERTRLASHRRACQDSHARFKERPPAYVEGAPGLGAQQNVHGKEGVAVQHVLTPLSSRHKLCEAGSLTGEASPVLSAQLGLHLSQCTPGFQPPRHSPLQPLQRAGGGERPPAGQRPPGWRVLPGVLRCSANSTTGRGTMRGSESNSLQTKHNLNK